MYEPEKFGDRQSTFSSKVYRHILNSPTRYGQRAFIQNVNLIHGIYHLNLDSHIIPRQPCNILVSVLRPMWWGYQHLRFRLRDP
jgi:hypothetical protein